MSECRTNAVGGERVALKRMASVDPVQHSHLRVVGQAGGANQAQCANLGKSGAWCCGARGERERAQGACLCLAGLATHHLATQTEDLIHDSWASGSKLAGRIRFRRIELELVAFRL